MDKHGASPHERTKTMITAIVAAWLAALTAGLFGFATADR
jgi:hypothetical protein